LILFVAMYRHKPACVVQTPRDLNATTPCVHSWPDLQSRLQQTTPDRMEVDCEVSVKIRTKAVKISNSYKFKSADTVEWFCKMM
jgi:hypothetical protein